MAKYRVAIATNDGENVNVHFGHAAAFLRKSGFGTFVDVFGG